jgi:hypothetical protein
MTTTSPLSSAAARQPPSRSRRCTGLDIVDLMEGVFLGK